VQIASGPFSLPDAEIPRPDVPLALSKDEGSAEGCGASAPLPPLPCLFRNNCDKAAEFLTAAQRKVAHAIYMNVVAFVMLHGLDNCGFFTVTFAEDLSWREAQRRLHNYTRRVLGPLFVDRIKVLEFTKNGRPHYHLIVACGADIRIGFNFEYLAEVALWNRYLKRIGEPKPQGTLNRNALLVSLHERLNATGGKYGVGRMELVPLKTCAQAVGRYVGGYLKKSVGGRKAEHKGARFVSYSRGFERAYKGNFTWLEGGREWRQKVAIFAARYGCSTMPELRSLFGPKWAYHHGDSIRQITLPNEQTTSTAAAALATTDCQDPRDRDRCSSLNDSDSRKSAGSDACPGDDDPDWGTAFGDGDSGNERGSCLYAEDFVTELVPPNFVCGRGSSRTDVAVEKPNAASTEHESTRQGAPGDALRRCSPPSETPATNQEGGAARSGAETSVNFSRVRVYSLAKRNMWGPPVHYQRPLKLNPPEREP
jgi:hypothetical protein